MKLNKFMSIVPCFLVHILSITHSTGWEYKLRGLQDLHTRRFKNSNAQKRLVQ